MSVSVEISYGELIDRITILQIKARRLSDPARRERAVAELARLEQRRREALPDGARLAALTRELSEVNQRLWSIEDAIRAKERAKTFDAAFVELARSVYLQNDVRARIKRRIDEELGSGLVEEKEYQRY